LLLECSKFRHVHRLATLNRLQEPLFEGPDPVASIMASDRNAGGPQLLGIGRVVHRNSSQSCSCAAVAGNDGSSSGLRRVGAHQPSFSLRPRRIGRRVSSGKGRAKIRARSSVECMRAKAGRERPERQSLTLSYIPEQGPSPAWLATSAGQRDTRGNREDRVGTPSSGEARTPARLHPISRL
jgi:hypothetical protein